MIEMTPLSDEALTEDERARQRQGLLRQVPRRVGETTITGKNQISLPAQATRALGWEKGDRLLVMVQGDSVVLMRRPDDWSEAFAGRLTGVFGTHEEVLRYLDEERRSWEDEE